MTRIILSFPCMGIMSYIGQDPEAFYDTAQLSHLSLVKVPPRWYLSDVINAGLV